MRFFASDFFHGSPSPKCISIPLGPFKMFKNLWRYLQVKVHYRYQRHQWNICRRCQQHRWQIMGTLSGCWHLKWTWRQKFIFTTQRCPNKIIKIFLIEDFFYLPPVSTTPVVHLDLRISPRICEKIWNGPNGKLRRVGETDSWKKPEVENPVTLSLKTIKGAEVKTENKIVFDIFLYSDPFQRIIL